MVASPDQLPTWMAPLERLLRPWFRDLRRAAVSADALLTLDDVIELIPGRDADVRGWVKANVKALDGPCGALYRWRDVLRAMGSAEDAAAGGQAPPKRAAPVRAAVELRRGTY